MRHTGPTLFASLVIILMPALVSAQPCPGGRLLLLTKGGEGGGTRDRKRWSGAGRVTRRAPSRRRSRSPGAGRHSRASATSVPDGAFITAIGGLQPRQFAENRMPTLAELDAAAPRHPVYIHVAFNGPAATNSFGKKFFESPRPDQGLRHRLIEQNGPVGRARRAGRELDARRHEANDARGLQLLQQRRPDHRALGARLAGARAGAGPRHDDHRPMLELKKEGGLTLRLRLYFEPIRTPAPPVGWRSDGAISSNLSGLIVRLPERRRLDNLRERTECRASAGCGNHVAMMSVARTSPCKWFGQRSEVRDRRSGASRGECIGIPGCSAANAEVRGSSRFAGDLRFRTLRPAQNRLWPHQSRTA